MRHCVCCLQGFGGEPVTVSEFMESAFGYEQSMVWWCVLIAFAYCIFFRRVGGRDATAMLSLHEACLLPAAGCGRTWMGVA